MAQGWCTECDSLQPISTTGIPLVDGFSACWWSICVHPDKHKDRDEDGRWPLCEGSGRKL